MPVIFADHFSLAAISDFALNVSPEFLFGVSGNIYSPNFGSTLGGTLDSTVSGTYNTGRYVFPPALDSGTFIFTYSLFSTTNAGSSYNGNINDLSVTNGTLLQIIKADTAGYFTSAYVNTASDPACWALSCIVKVTAPNCTISVESFATDWTSTSNQFGDLFVTQLPDNIT